jgi:hypothetical protein
MRVQISMEAASSGLAGEPFAVEILTNSGEGFLGIRLRLRPADNRVDK